MTPVGAVGVALAATIVIALNGTIGDSPAFGCTAERRYWSVLPAIEALSGMTQECALRAGDAMRLVSVLLIRWYNRYSDAPATVSQRSIACDALVCPAHKRVGISAAVCEYAVLANPNEIAMRAVLTRGCIGPPESKRALTLCPA